MGKYIYMTAKCDICLKVVAAEVFEKDSNVESFLNKYERNGYVVEESKTPPMIEGCQCKQELARLRAALAAKDAEIERLKTALIQIANTCENFDGCPVGPQTIAEVAPRCGGADERREK